MRTIPSARMPTRASISGCCGRSTLPATWAYFDPTLAHRVDLAIWIAERGCEQRSAGEACRVFNCGDTDGGTFASRSVASQKPRTARTRQEGSAPQPTCRSASYGGMSPASEGSVRGLDDAFGGHVVCGIHRRRSRQNQKDRPFLEDRSASRTWSQASLVAGLATTESQTR